MDPFPAMPANPMRPDEGLMTTPWDERNPVWRSYRDTPVFAPAARRGGNTMAATDTHRKFPETKRAAA